MFGSGSLFNLSLGDLKNLLKDRDKNQAIQRKREFDDLKHKFTEVSNMLDQDDVPKETRDILKEMSNDLKSQKDNAEKAWKKAQIDDQIRPRKDLNRIISDMTGGILDFDSGASLGILKGTSAFMGAWLTSSMFALSSMNDIIIEMGINNEHLLDTFININDEVNQLALNGERVRGTTVGHLNTLMSIREVYGANLSASIQTLDTIESFPLSLGLTAEQGRDFLNTMRGITGESAELNADLIRSLATMTDMNNIPFAWVMSDITENADFFAVRSGRGMENIANSVVFARRLGIEMGTITNMLSGLETVEGVIESQMKLALFTGQQFNLLDSATANFFGDTEDAVMGILKQIETVDDEIMNMPFVRRQMAEQLNVSATELNNIVESVRRLGAESVALDFGFSDEMDEFFHMTTGVGMTRVRNSVTENLINPLRNATAQNIIYLDSAFELIDKIMGVTGDILVPFVERFPTLIPIAVGLASAVSSIGMSTMIEGQQLYELKQIKKFTAISASQSAGRGGGGAMAFGKKVGLYTGALMGAGMFADQMMRDTDDANLLTSMIGMGITGASLGGFGGLTGAGIGGLIGLGVGAGGHFLMHDGLDSGGLAMTPMISPIAETRPEAVIPLESSKTKEMLTLNLSDSSIDKLARAIAREGVDVEISYNLNGRRMDDSEEFFREIAR